MGYYNRRDLIGHFVKRDKRTQQMCQHACCRGYRVHPSNFPVILPNALLRRASEDDLADHFAKVANQNTDAEIESYYQILWEMERRDKADVKRHERKTEAQRRLFARKLARQEEVDRMWLDAEAVTRGNMLNRAGKAAGVDERSLFTGPESRARRYASEELLNYWQDHPRPTSAYFAGKDTRLGPMYTAPRKRRSPARRSRLLRTSTRDRAA